MKRLTKTQILKMHSLLIQKTGGSDDVKDEGLLDSALNLPFQSFDLEIYIRNKYWNRYLQIIIYKKLWYNIYE